MSLNEQTKAIQSFITKHSKVSDIPARELSDFYIQLIDCLVDHNHQYYIEDKPLISDKEYDDLFSYLKKIEEAHPEIITSNSPTQGLIGQISEWFQQAKHMTKLMSLENTYNAQDLKERDTRAKKIVEKNNSQVLSGGSLKFSVEPKFDGLSVELIYEKWIFKQAITRWDGRVGEDITVNMKTIKNIPQKLKDPIDISVRGEILMPKSVWKEINKEREEDGETPFANTRNAAAGSIKLLDSAEVARRGLVCYIYDVLKIEDGKLKMDILQFLWLPVFKWKKEADTIDEVIKICLDEKVKKELDSQDIEFDGLVIKVQNEEQREIIWATDHHPRRAVAYKFPAQLAATQVLSVDFQVGRTWIITPVANLEPVQLSWAKLQRVSLHNFDFIKDKDIHLHDWIWLQRSGEVIPYIVSVITDRRTGEEKIIHPPKVCPSCNEAVMQKDMHYYCVNEHCPEKTKQQIQHFVSKNCMDIMGIGESIVDLLVENKIIENIADIYKLSDPTIQIQLRKFPWFGDKKVTEIAKGVEESKHKALRRLLNGLWISHVGKKMAQDIASQIEEGRWKIENVDNLEKAITDITFLDSIYWIWEKTVESITTFFHNKHNLKLLEQLEKAGINIDPNKYTDLIKASEAKGSFSITGSFDLPREKIAELFQQQGYLLHESPTKSTDFMLIGEKAGSKKKKAQELGLIIYEWRESITKQFPFLKTIITETNKPKTQSLF